MLHQLFKRTREMGLLRLVFLHHRQCLVNLNNLLLPAFLVEVSCSAQAA